MFKGINNEEKMSELADRVERFSKAWLKDEEIIIERSRKEK